MKIQTIQPPGNEAITASARAYACGFKQITTDTIIDRKLFADRFQSLLWKRYQAVLLAGNLLTPVETKGFHEILRLYKMDSPALPYLFELDLPTIILYAMLLESGELRMVFAKMSYREKQTTFNSLFKEVNSICPYQCFSPAKDFEVEHSLRINKFLATCGDAAVRKIIAMKNAFSINEAAI